MCRRGPARPRRICSPNISSGPVLRFPPAAALLALMARRIGVESMDTRAACRTYNILAGEDRRVVAALWLPGS